MFNPLMKYPPYDGVVEAVHYSPDGQIKWVRAYERRGPTWSDRVLLDRQTLIERLKSGKRFYAGERIELRASEFNLNEPLKLVKSGDGEVVVVGEGQGKQDQLEGVPVL
jgi:hypothetical protein